MKNKTKIFTILFFLVIISNCLQVQAGTWSGYKFPGDVVDINSKVTNEKYLKADDSKSAEVGFWYTYALILLYKFDWDIGEKYIYSIKFELEAKYGGLGWGKYKAIIKDSEDNLIDESSYSDLFTTSYGKYHRTIAINGKYDPNDLKYYIRIAKPSFCSVYMDYVRVTIQYEQ